MIHQRRYNFVPSFCQGFITRVINSSTIEETVENFSEENVIDAINNKMSWVTQSGIFVINIKKSE